jgi:diguanylate cyclase (GGDEF)-like protein
MDLITDTESQKHRIMVVDSSEQAEEKYVGELAQHFLVSFTTTTDQAWELLTRAPLPDAIILDTMISNKDGFQFCHRLKENPYFNNIPILFVSDVADPASRTKAFELGCSDFVTKPPVMAELFARLNHHIHQYHKTKRLESLIFIDPLTHLPNAAKFNEVLHQEWSRCARYWHHLALILVHINNMTLIRKEFGLDEYYALTASIADDLCSVGARPGDLFASIDNNTFALLLSDCSLEGATLKVAQIRRKFDHPNFMTKHQSSGKMIDCTVAYTVAAPAGGSSSQELLQTTQALLLQHDQNHSVSVFSTPNILGIDGMTQSAHL